MIERIKQARNTGAAMTISAGETKSRMRPKVRLSNDQKEGFQSFLLKATVGGGPSMAAPSNLARFSKITISQKIGRVKEGPLTQGPLGDGASIGEKIAGKPSHSPTISPESIPGSISVICTTWIPPRHNVAVFPGFFGQDDLFVLSPAYLFRCSVSRL
jgi:hypothetical protein